MDTAIRTTRQASQAQEWALVLAAAGIPHRVAPDGTDVSLFVSAEDAPRARASLDAYDEEAREAPALASAPAASSRVAWAVGIAAAAAILAWFAVTGPPRAGSRWFERGAAVSARLVGGEPWRAVTALTLHLDAVHVAGNAAATAVLGAAVVRQLGPGCGLWLLLLAGAAGNLLSAAARDPAHVSVGASTATFGAIGVLAALRLVRAAGAPGLRGRRWMVPAASLLLLAMLGTSPDADVLAHALGLVSGGLLGFAAGTARHRPLGPRLQWALAALVPLAVAGAWRLALGAPPG